MDYNEARKILYEHTSAIMSACATEFGSNTEMLEFTTKECGYILTEYLLEGKYTPMQYNAIRNELAQLLWGVFQVHVEKETQADLDEFIKSFSI